METVTVVRILGTVLCLTGIVLCWHLSRQRFSTLSTSTQVSVLVTVVSAAALWKLLAFVGFVAVPAATLAVANYHTFEGVHHPGACVRCHVTRPMVTDLFDPKRDTLAARHYRDRWIP